MYSEFKFLSLLILVFGNTTNVYGSYPSIHEIVSFKRPNMTEAEGVNIESGLTIDIEKLDMDRIKNDDSAFRQEIMGSLGGDVLLEHDKEARRVQAFYPYRGLSEYHRAYELQYRTKMADCMLQLIYMARSKIKAFESQGYIKRESSGYRVGFIIRKLENLFFRSRRYLTVMVMRQSKWKWDTESTSILNLHNKIVMAHHDFNRLFFMQMALHERLEQIEGRPIHSSTDHYTTSTHAVKRKFDYDSQPEYN